MPEQTTMIVRRWGWCRGWAGIPYPCRKTSEEVRWCYTFELARHRCFGFYQQVHACENGTEYHYTTSCFGWWHNWQLVTAPFTRCFDQRLDEDGPCSLSGTFPAPDPRLS